MQHQRKHCGTERGVNQTAVGQEGEESGMDACHEHRSGEKCSGENKKPAEEIKVL